MSEQGKSPTISGNQETSQETSVEKLHSEFERLKFDLREGEHSLPNFNGKTGERYEPNSEEQLGEGVRRCTGLAIENLSFALQMPPQTKFDPYTGEKISEEPSERLAHFRKKAGEEIKRAIESGVAIHSFDPLTGERIPPDSLRALEMSRNTVEDDNEEMDMRAIDFGLETLTRLKRAKKRWGD